MPPQDNCDAQYKNLLAVPAKLGLAVLAVAIWLMWPSSVQAFEPWWVQNHMETELWSGKIEGAESFGRVTQWNYFQVVAPQGNDSRLYILNPKTNNYAYIDAVAVGPSGPPPSQPVTAQNEEEEPENEPTQVEIEQKDESEAEEWLAVTQVSAELWSGTDENAISFGWIPRGTKLQIISKQDNRYHVINCATNNYAFIDIEAVVQHSAEQNADVGEEQSSNGLRKIPKLANGYEGWWVSNFLETELWKRPTGNDKESSLGFIPQFKRFLVVEPQNGDRLKVWYPEKDVIGYIEASTVGPSCESIWVEGHTIREEREIATLGRSVGEKTFARSLPIYDPETEMRRLPNNTEVSIRKSVTTTDGKEWFELDDGGYILASEVRVPRAPERYYSGRWIDVDLDVPAIIAAYEGDRMVKTALAITGVSAFPTPVGNFQILRRVANETMDSETVGIPRDQPGGYYLKNVLYTQYFTNDGASLHYNYWRGTFGYPGSHGCLGLSLEDSIWFWEWSDVGTPVIVRHGGASQMVQTGTGDATSTE
jgi:hypothetical protein